MHSLVVTQMSHLELPWHLGEHRVQVLSQHRDWCMCLPKKAEHELSLPAAMTHWWETSEERWQEKHTLFEGLHSGHLGGHTEELAVSNTLHYSATYLYILSSSSTHSRTPETELEHLTSHHDLKRTAHLPFTPLHTNHYVHFYLNTTLSKEACIICFYSLEVLW